MVCFRLNDILIFVISRKCLIAENQQAVAFLLLPLLLGSQPTKGRADQERYKPSLIEVQQSFVLYIEVKILNALSTFKN